MIIILLCVSNIEILHIFIFMHGFFLGGARGETFYIHRLLTYRVFQKYMSELKADFELECGFGNAALRQ